MDHETDIIDLLEGIEIEGGVIPPKSTFKIRVHIRNISKGLPAIPLWSEDMPQFSELSKKRLCECHPDLQKIFTLVINYIDCTIITGYRSEIEQNQAFEHKKSKLKYPHSKHNLQPSLAVDVAIYPIDWNNKKRFYYFAGFVMAITKMLKEIGEINHNIKWGGDWDMDNDLDDQNLYDLVHFEMVK